MCRTVLQCVAFVKNCVANASHQDAGLCFAVCCDMLQRVAVSACMPHIQDLGLSVAVCWLALQCVVVYCSVMCNVIVVLGTYIPHFQNPVLGVAECCSVLQCVAVCCSCIGRLHASHLEFVSAFCRVLRCFAECVVWYIVLQSVAVCCSERL